MKKRIVQSKANSAPAGHITKTLTDSSLRFSFEHLDLYHEKFTIAKKDAQYFTHVLERFRDVSS
jgi:hypothetical protein